MLSAIRAVTQQQMKGAAASFHRFHILTNFTPPLYSKGVPVVTSGRFLSSATASDAVTGNSDSSSNNSDGYTRDPDTMKFLHFGKRPRFRGYQKFKSPRKRASTLFGQLNEEACQKAKESNPAVWQENIQVGDAVEIKMVVQGGLKENERQETEKVRGMVLGIVKRGLGSSILLRDVVYGVPIERRIPMYSPMILDAQILEKNFLHKGKKKVRRSKLYYLRDRNPLLTKVSKY
jgi:large subunit ribosomal protein L19